MTAVVKNGVLLSCMELVIILIVSVSYLLVFPVS